MNWDEGKKRTEVLVPWITVIGLIVGGIYSGVQYTDHKHEQRVEQTMKYVDRFMTAPLSEYRTALSEVWQGNQNEILSILRRPDPQAQINKAYNDKILSMVNSSHLSPMIEEMVLYYEQLARCTVLNVCDEPAVTSILEKHGRTFFRRYYPYICHLRNEWNDSTIGADLEKYFNPTSVGKSCA